MKKSNRSTAAAPTILKGTTLAGSAVAQQPKSGRLKFIESPEFGAGYLIVGDDMMVGMQKTFLDNLQESHVTQLEDGTFRVDLKETRVGLRLTRDELDFLLSRRETQSAFRIDSSFDAAASADAAPAGKQARGKGAAKTGAAKTGAAKSTAARVSGTAPVTAETAPKAHKAKAAKPAKAPKAPKAGKTPATEAAAVETAPKTTAKTTAKGKKTAAPAPAVQGSEPVSLAAHRSKRQAAQKAAGKGQAELPGLTPAEPLRRAARNANNDQRIKEPKFVSEGAASSAAKSSAAPGNGRRKATGSDASAPAPSGRGKGKGKGKAAARSNARTSLKAGTATTVESSDATPSTGGKGQAKATRGKAGTTKAQGTGKATTAKAAKGSADVSGAKSPTAKGSARSTGAKASSGTATASEGVATTGQVKDAVREILTSLNRPVPRQELLTLVEQKLSARVPGKKPVDNLVTMLYKDPDQGFENIKSRGFWLKGQAVPQA